VKNSAPFQFVEDTATWTVANSLIARVPRTARGKQKLLGVLANRLHFPRYFGWNWDALEECLRDLNWLADAKQIAIVHAAVPLSPRGDQLQTYLGVLAGAVEFRSNATEPPKLIVVFPAECRAEIETAMSDSPRR
jgi:hypothetical protein